MPFDSRCRQGGVDPPTWQLVRAAKMMPRQAMMASRNHTYSTA